MEKTIASKIISLIAGSIKDNPAQFNFEVNIIGTSVTNSDGIGIQATAHGGSAGSTTIGYQSTVSEPSIEVRQKVNQTVNNSELVESLEAISAEIEKSNPDVSEVKGFFGKLLKETVPQVIGTIVAELILQSTGIKVS